MTEQVAVVIQVEDNRQLKLYAIQLSVVDTGGGGRLQWFTEARSENSTHAPNLFTDHVGDRSYT